MKKIFINLNKVLSIKKEHHKIIYVRYNIIVDEHLFGESFEFDSSNERDEVYTYLIDKLEKQCEQ